MKRETKKNLNEIALYASVVAAGFLARYLLGRIWEARKDEPPPKNPAQPGVSWQEALTWGGTVGVVAGLARTAVSRGYQEVFPRDSGS